MEATQSFSPATLSANVRWLSSNANYETLKALKLIARVHPSIETFPIYRFPKSTIDELRGRGLVDIATIEVSSLREYTEGMVQDVGVYKPTFSGEEVLKRVDLAKRRRD